MVGTIQQFVQEFELAVARGAVRNTNGNAYRAIRKVGFNPAVGVSDEFIWPNAAAFNGFLSGSRNLRVAAGGHVNDDIAGGSGARRLQLVGIDRDGNPRTEELQLRGATASNPTTEQFIRVNEVYVSEVGAYGGSNAGPILIEATSGERMAYIPAGRSRDQQAIYSVAKNHTALLRSVDMIVDARSGASFRLVKRVRNRNTSTTVAPYETLWESGPLEQKQYRHPFVSPIVLEQDTDVWVFANSATTDGADLTVCLDLLLIPDQ